MADLKTDYKDDVLDTTQNTRRKYQMINNQDGTVSFVDVTEYIQQGDSFGADDVNAITDAINKNDGVPVGAVVTFDGSQLPYGFEPYTTAEQTAIQQINDKLTTLPGLTQIGTTGVYYRVYNRIVEIFIATPSITVSNSGTKIATLPATVPKPPITLVTSAGNILNPSTYSLIQVAIYASGNISVANYAVVNAGVLAHITYLA